MRKKFNTYIIGDIIAYTLRVFGQGMKVVCEVGVMARTLDLFAPMKTLSSLPEQAAERIPLLSSSHPTPGLF